MRWKRLVVDEGHIAGNTTATINSFVQQLSIQHKWIVTGTPTSNILGLNLGRTTDEQESNHHIDLVESVLNYPHSGSPTATSSSQDDRRCMRVWGSYENLNLRKLRTMIGDFLSVFPFTDSKWFTAHVSSLLCDRRGPRPGAIDVLSQVMQMVMVRHRSVKQCIICSRAYLQPGSIEDVENEVLLPPMKHDIIYMDLDNYALKSYNALQAAVAINAIDSRRTGSVGRYKLVLCSSVAQPGPGLPFPPKSTSRDMYYVKQYFNLPPSEPECQGTTDDYKQLVTVSHWAESSLLSSCFLIFANSRSLFWSSSDILYNVNDICCSADAYIHRVVDREPDQEASPEELDLLRQALKHAYGLFSLD